MVARAKVFMVTSVDAGKVKRGGQARFLGAHQKPLLGEEKGRGEVGEY
jgi:hypothetical protein